jgi:hypothetical protein
VIEVGFNDGVSTAYFSVLFIESSSRRTGDISTIYLNGLSAQKLKIEEKSSV